MNPESNKILLYTTPSGDIRIDVYVEDGTVWLTQKSMAELFGVVKSTISEHIAKIFETGELEKEATVRNFRTVQLEGSRNVSRNVE